MTNLYAFLQAILLKGNLIRDETFFKQGIEIGGSCLTQVWIYFEFHCPDRL